MQFDKDQVVKMLQDQGKQEEAGQAQQEMPDKVDHEKDAGLLEKFGINPMDLVSKFTGGKGIPGM